MYPLYDHFNDNKVFVSHPIRQRIYTPLYRAFSGISIFEYVLVKRTSGSKSIGTRTQAMLVSIRGKPGHVIKLKNS